MAISDAKRHASTDVILESSPARGYNYRLTDNPSRHRPQTAKAGSRYPSGARHLAARYEEIMHNFKVLILPNELEGIRINWQSYCVRLHEECNKIIVLQFLMDERISERREIISSCLEEAYDTDHNLQTLQASSSAARSDLLLPLFPGITAEQQDRVAQTLRQACYRA